MGLNALVKTKKTVVRRFQILDRFKIIEVYYNLGWANVEIWLQYIQ